MIYKTALCFAIEKSNFEIIKLILKQPNVDINIINISILFDYRIPKFIFK